MIWLQKIEKLLKSFFCLLDLFKVLKIKYLCFFSQTRSGWKGWSSRFICWTIRDNGDCRFNSTSKICRCGSCSSSRTRAWRQVVAGNYRWKFCRWSFRWIRKFSEELFSELLSSSAMCRISNAVKGLGAADVSAGWINGSLGALSAKHSSADFGPTSPMLTLSRRLVYLSLGVEGPCKR